jgi:hypothetical protein
MHTHHESEVGSKIDHRWMSRDSEIAGERVSYPCSSVRGQHLFRKWLTGERVKVLASFSH